MTGCVATPEKPAATLEVSLEGIRRVVSHLKGGATHKHGRTMSTLAEELGVKRGTLSSWLRGDTQPGAKATNVLLKLLAECPLTHEERMEIRSRARHAIWRGEVAIHLVPSREAAEAHVKVGEADAWGEREPEQYRFWGMGVHGPDQFVTFLFHDRELAADVAKPGVAGF